MPTRLRSLSNSDRYSDADAGADGDDSAKSDSHTFPQFADPDADQARALGDEIARGADSLLIYIRGARSYASH